MGISPWVRCALGLPASLHGLEELELTNSREKGLPWGRIVLGAAWTSPGWRGEVSSLAMAGPAGLGAGMGSGSMYLPVMFTRINVICGSGAQRGLNLGDSHLSHSAELPSCVLTLWGGACGIKVQPNDPGDLFPS